ncbi:MAG: hypothetical protein R3A46_15190 [Thermomicrobiales bacterium]
MDYVLVAQSDITSVEELDGGIGMFGPAGYDALLSRLTIRNAGMELSGCELCPDWWKRRPFCGVAR